MLSQIAYLQIKENYCYGAYGDFRVVMMKDNGYINVTNMCISGKRNYWDWSRSGTNNELVETVNRILNANTAETALPQAACIYVRPACHKIQRGVRCFSQIQRELLFKWRVHNSRFAILSTTSLDACSTITTTSQRCF
jgi:KilA-N domain